MRLITCLQHVHRFYWRPIIRGHYTLRAQIKLVVFLSLDSEKLFVIHFYVLLRKLTSICWWKIFSCHESFSFDHNRELFEYNQINKVSLKVDCVTLELGILLFNWKVLCFRKAKIHPLNVIKMKDGRRLNWGGKWKRKFSAAKSFHFKWNQ